LVLCLLFNILLQWEIPNPMFRKPLIFKTHEIFSSTTHLMPEIAMNNWDNFTTIYKGEYSYINWWSADMTKRVDASYGLHSMDVIAPIRYLKWATNGSSCKFTVAIMPAQPQCRVTEYASQQPEYVYILCSQGQCIKMERKRYWTRLSLEVVQTLPIPAANPKLKTMNLIRYLLKLQKQKAKPHEGTSGAPHTHYQ
jgi:hypothetical protein